MTPIQRKIVRTERWNTWKARIYAALMLAGLALAKMANDTWGAK